MKKGRLGTMTHDYKRHGTTTLFAALNVLRSFINAIEAIPAGKGVHVDNYAAHKHAKVRAWLGRHERFTFHFVPTSCSWLMPRPASDLSLSPARLSPRIPPTGRATCRNPRPATLASRQPVRSITLCGPP